VADTNGHSDSSFAHGTPLDEPIDLVAVQADDELINALAAGMAVSSVGAGGYHADDQVVALLSAWREDVTAEPIPELIDLETAVAAVKSGSRAARPTRSARVRHLVPVAAAAAFLVLVGGGVSIGSANAQPDSALWPVSKMLFTERAVSLEAAVRASDKIDNAKQALNQGKPDVAAADLAQAQQDLQSVRPQEGQAQLVDVKDFLTAKAAETPSGTSVDPASPLKADQQRPIPVGAALSQEPTAVGTLSPTPTPAEDPTTASSRPSRSPRPTSRPGGHGPSTPVTAAPEVTTGSAGASAGAGASAEVPTTATPEGEPDTTSDTSTTTGLGTTTTGIGATPTTTTPIPHTS